MPATAVIGTDTSRETPLNRAENCIKSFPILRLRVASALILRTISPLRTNSSGTRVLASTLTATYGVRPLSSHHSQMARIRYGVVDDEAFTCASPFPKASTPQ